MVGDRCISNNAKMLTKETGALLIFWLRPKVRERRREQEKSICMRLIDVMCGREMNSMFGSSRKRGQRIHPMSASCQYYMISQWMRLQSQIKLRSLTINRAEYISYC